MSRETPAAGGAAHVRNLQVLVGLAGLIFFAWAWIAFSGPFRMLVDLQWRVAGGYSEAVAAAVLGLGVIAVIVLAAYGVAWVCADLAEGTVNAAVAVLLAAVTVAALGQVGRLWREAARLPRLSDPVQVVDLATLGTRPPALGHVRLIGEPDRARQVLIYRMGRKGRGSDWTAWVPIVARGAARPQTAALVVGTFQDPDPAIAAQGVGSDPQGLLLAHPVDNRMVYEARRDGLDLAAHPFVLFADEGVRFDTFLNAVLLGGAVLLFWGLAGYSWLKERHEGQVEVTAPAPIPVPRVPVPSGPAAPSVVPVSEPAESALFRFGMGGAVLALLAAWLLWQGYGLFPNRVALMGYAAAAVTFGVSMLLLWWGQGDQVAVPANPAPPVSAAAASAMQPPPGAALLYVLRDEAKFSSPSYKRVALDGERVAVLKAHQYTAVALRPGVHTLAVNTRRSLASDTVARFEAAVGEVVVYRMQIPFFGPMRLERASDMFEARAALGRLKPVLPAVP